MNKIKQKILLDVWPKWENDTVSNSDISICLSNTNLEENSQLLVFIDEMYNIPGSVDWTSISLFDDNGNIPYYFEKNEIQHKKTTKIFIKRTTVGQINIKYIANFLPARPNPVMDMGQEKGGITGTGYFWLPKFNDGEYVACLNFHRDYMPKGSRMLCGYGEEHIENLSIKEDGLQNVFYCFGILDCVEQDNFGYYWIKRDGFDAKEIGEWTRDTFLKMASFFQDNGECYKIFARARSCKYSGGTAANRSYTYIYDPDNLPSFVELKFLFPHEMVHNWARINDNPYGTCTWYSEGMAEYYSLILPWRLGLVTREELANQLQDKINQYYKNPCRNYTNIRLGNLLFHDLEATTVPYGRGLFYLMEVDKRIREATDNKKSLDNVVINIINKYKNNKEIQNIAWINAVMEEASIDETENLLRMSQGELIKPNLSCFINADFVLEEKESLARRNLESCISYLIK